MTDQIAPVTSSQMDAAGEHRNKLVNYSTTVLSLDKVTTNKLLDQLGIKRGPTGSFIIDGRQFWMLDEVLELALTAVAHR